MRFFMSELAQKKCVPCKGGMPPLKGEDLQTYQSQIHTNWNLVNEHHLEREFSFKNFSQALEFVNRVGELAEQESHHPDISLGWGYVKISLHTHKIDGLTESDFILAAKIDKQTW